LRLIQKVLAQPREALRSRNRRPPLPQILPSGVLEKWKVLTPICVKVRMEKSWDVGLLSVPTKIAVHPNRPRHSGTGSQWASAEMTSPVSGLKETRLSRGTRLEKVMKSRIRTNKASLQGIATGTPLLPVFAVSVSTLGFVLSANANERKTAIITFDAPGAGTGPLQGTLTEGVAPTPPIRTSPATKQSPTAGC
jgi:hypothetical protein